MYEWMLNCAYLFLMVGMSCFLVSAATSAGFGFDLELPDGIVNDGVRRSECGCS